MLLFTGLFLLCGFFFWGGGGVPLHQQIISPPLKFTQIGLFKKIQSKIHPVLNSPTDDGGNIGENRLVANIFLCIICAYSSTYLTAVIDWSTLHHTVHLRERSFTVGVSFNMYFE